jgi:hypothetical protein
MRSILNGNKVSSVQRVKFRKNVKLSLCFLTKHHGMKAYWGSGRIALLIL